jgi:hypothetical protein
MVETSSYVGAVSRATATTSPMEATRPPSQYQRGQERKMFQIIVEAITYVVHDKTLTIL